MATAAPARLDQEGRELGRRPVGEGDSVRSTSAGPKAAKPTTVSRSTATSTPCPGVGGVTAAASHACAAASSSHSSSTAVGSTVRYAVRQVTA